MHHAQGERAVVAEPRAVEAQQASSKVMFDPCAQSQEVHQRRHVEVGAGAVNNASADVGAPRHEAQSAFFGIGREVSDDTAIKASVAHQVIREQRDDDVPD